jgi:hypothetical protein
MYKKLALVFSVLSIFALAVSPAIAQSTTGFFTAHITSIQTTSGATSFDFTTDNTPSSCNGFIFYNATGADEATQIANASAALASLLAAEISGHSVNLIGNIDGFSTYCSVSTIFVNNQ